jgi:hypothetical protein
VHLFGSLTAHVKGATISTYDLFSTTWLGHEVKVCLAFTLEVIHVAPQSILDIGKKKDEREALSLEIAIGGVVGSLETTSFLGVGGFEFSYFQNR